MSAACIEFLGVPGAGKSSLVPVVTGELQRAGVNAVEIAEATYAALRDGMQDRLIGPVFRNMPRSLGSSLSKHLVARSQDRMLAMRGFLLDHPETAIAILEALSDRKDVDPRQDLALGWILELLWSYQLATSQGGSGSLLVLDEGFANRAVTLFGYRFSEEDEPRLRQYIESIPKPDLVIVVAGDTEVCAARASNRIRFAHLGYSELVRFTREAATCVDVTSRLLAEHGVDVRTVQNESLLSVASSEVRRIIRDWLDGQ